MQSRVEKQLEEGKPETFDFLGFTFYCSRTRQGKACIKVKTRKKKFKQKVKAMKVWLYENRDIRVKELMEKLRIKLLGQYRYYEDEILSPALKIVTNTTVNNILNYILGFIIGLVIFFSIEYITNEIKVKGYNKIGKK